MIRVERLLQVHIGLLCFLGALMLGMARRDLSAPMITGFAVVAAIIFADTLGWLRLNRFVVNLAALTIMFFCMFTFLRGDTYGKLVTIGDLLVYWQLVMLFQTKLPRVYWSLAVVSLLQVVVASVLQAGAEFGPLLLLYALVGVFALALFYLWRQGFQMRRVAAAAQPAAVGGERDGDRQGVSREAMLGGKSVAYQENSDLVLRRCAGWPFVRQVSGVAVASLILMIAFFYFMPRHTQSGLYAASDGASARTGFSRNLSLGDISQIQQSDELVMRVMFTSPRTREPYDVFGEPYFQGTVLSEYTSREGSAHWRAASDSPGDIYSLPAAPLSEDVVRQEVYLQPTREPTLFSVFPALSLPDTPASVRYNVKQHELVRQPNDRRGSTFRYALATTGFYNGVQSPIVLSRYRQVNDEQRRDARRELEAAMQLPPAEGFSFGEPPRDPLEGLKRVAEQALRDGETDRTNRILVARALESHFRGLGLYTYALDIRDVDLDRTIDPVEDFVVNHRTGHCTLFASALVLMLRSQEIPARMVVGFHGDELNTLGNYYQVRGRHAHAWVEAYLRPEDLPSELRLHPDQGGWLRLDPTPSSLAPAEPSLLDRVTDSLDYAQLLWSGYMQRDGQQSHIFDPLGGAAALGWLFDRDAWREWLDQLAHRWGISERWVSWRAGLLAMAVSFVVYGIYRLTLLALRPLLHRWFTARRAAARLSPIEVAWYRRLERLLERAGVARTPSQTGRELARVAADRFAQIPQLQPLGETPALVTRSYYDLRFGRLPLSPERVDELQRQLNRLEAAIADYRQSNGQHGTT